MTPQSDEATLGHMKALAGIDRLQGRHIIASMSGGKDSTAMALALKALGLPYTAVFLDTGWEHPTTYEYLDYLAEAMGHPIERVKGPHTMISLVRSKGTFPRMLRQFCSTELKVKPMQAYIADRLEHEEVVNTIGVRRAESRRRAAMEPWEASDGFDCDVWRPILHWTEADVIAMHTRHGIRPNPLYLMGMSRVGCWPCIHASKADLRVIAENDPGRVDTIRELEAEIGAGARERAAGRGQAYEHDPAFFTRSMPERDTRGFVPIDEIVRWSKTSRGGRQVELYTQPETPGCVRWGLCEPNIEKP